MRAISAAADMALGVMISTPAMARTMVEKIGLRTVAKAPVVTKPVRSDGSTPMRHESPIACCAANTRASPITASPRPSHQAQRGIAIVEAGTSSDKNGRCPRMSAPANSHTPRRPALLLSEAIRRIPGSPVPPVVLQGPHPECQREADEVDGERYECLRIWGCRHVGCFPSIRADCREDSF